jgi:hypothetical protein
VINPYPFSGATPFRDIPIVTPPSTGAGVLNHSADHAEHYLIYPIFFLFDSPNPAQAYCTMCGQHDGGQKILAPKS